MSPQDKGLSMEEIIEGFQVLLLEYRNAYWQVLLHTVQEFVLATGNFIGHYALKPLQKEEAGRSNIYRT
jgi:hypothetical protein